MRLLTEILLEVIRAALFRLMIFGLTIFDLSAVSEAQELSNTRVASSRILRAVQQRDHTRAFLL
jgi:hypothetical protein